MRSNRNPRRYCIWILLASSLFLVSPARARKTGLNEEAVSQLNAGLSNTYGTITVDGDLTDWTPLERLDPAPGQSPPGYELYGKYDPTSATYLLAIRTDGTTIGPATTVWLNTDQDTSTGHQIWGWAGGAEYNVNFFTDSQPHLYTGSDGENWQYGPLDNAYGAGGQIVEFVIPGSQLTTPPDVGDIDILLDINNAVYLPTDYSRPPYTVTAEPLAPRSDPAKRVGIVFSDATADKFWGGGPDGSKAYSQLYTAMQHQAMMAGIPFDVLHDSDLTDATSIINYDALIFPYAAWVKAADLPEIEDTLFKAVYRYRIGLVTAGDFITNDETGAPLAGNPYRRMNELFGLERVAGSGPVTMDVHVADATHPVVRGYAAHERILHYDSAWFGVYDAVAGQPVVVLATQDVDDGSGVTTYNAVVATETGGRNVHFGSEALLGDSNLVWQALQWIVYGNATPVGLNMGRNDSIFISRCDMDESRFADDVVAVEQTLHDDFLVPWKNTYDFVGSFYINIGNDAAHGEYTDWNVSRPVYRNFLLLGNEIGTHSYTHPDNVNLLTESELEWEFNQSQIVIGTELGTTVLGAAVPGAPEHLSVTEVLDQYHSYLSGGWSGTGGGFRSAFGYLAPDYDMVYFAPNLLFDYTMIQDYGWTAAKAEAHWQQEFADLTAHASQPVIHWPWHDYGPTIGVAQGWGYSVAMYENLIATAFGSGTEFTTLADAHQRIKTLMGASLVVDGSASIIADVGATNLGRFSLRLQSDDIIRRVDNWYAYNDHSVFLPRDGGTFHIWLGAASDPATRITALPMRADLISVSGDGTELEYVFDGAGTVVITLNRERAADLVDYGADTSVRSGTILRMTFENEGKHTGRISLSQQEPVSLEEEFVPEPGTLVLLASGLAGLAGYATLRWRTRE